LYDSGKTKSSASIHYKKSAKRTLLGNLRDGLSGSGPGHAEQGEVANLTAT